MGTQIYASTHIMNTLALCLLVALASHTLADKAGLHGHHGHHSGHHAHQAPHPQQTHKSSHHPHHQQPAHKAVRRHKAGPQKLTPPRRPVSPLTALLAKPLSKFPPTFLTHHRASPVHSRRRSQNAGRLTNNHLHRAPVGKPAPVPKIAYLQAEQIPGFQKFELHEVIRAREGTQIFDGRKPDVIHYVNSPDVGQDDVIEKIDVRTPSDVTITAEKTEESS